jgi:PAS domain S-box-containing protein
MEAVRRPGAPKHNSRGVLWASERRFKRLFETARDGIIILNGQTHEIIEANPYITSLLGRSKKDLIGKHLSDIGILRDKEQTHSTFGQLHKGGCARFEHLLPGAEPGRFADLEFVCNSYQEDGQLLIQCNIRDIAKRKEGERRLREALEQVAAAKQELETRVRERTADLQQRNAELEAFSYSLSHDLRAPIRAIVSFTQLALQEYGNKVGRPATELLEKAITAAQRLDHLILDVLAFSKTTRQRLQPKRVELESLLRDILQERSEWAPPKVEIKIQTPLLPVQGDVASLTQCLTNLLDNAVKFVRRGVVPKVRVDTQQVGSRVRLNVRDNGAGVPASAQGRVFELFQRAHNGYEGYGIGLAIVRRAAERMGGSVGLESEAGKGSTFWIELPASEEN